MSKPEILCHPNIPKPLHGINPRVIKGNEWWQIKRQEVYKSTNYHCVACGIHKFNAKKHSWLEAHEFFDICYKTGKCEVKSIEPLCHYCHNFIHSGRMKMILNKEKSQEEIQEILEDGFKILKENKLKAFYFTIELAEYLGAKTFKVKPYYPEVNPELKWKDFYLLFEGEKYYSKFSCQEEWSAFYQNKRE